MLWIHNSRIKVLRKIRKKMLRKNQKKCCLEVIGDWVGHEMYLSLSHACRKKMQMQQNLLIPGRKPLSTSQSVLCVRRTKHSFVSNLEWNRRLQWEIRSSGSEISSCPCISLWAHFPDEPSWMNNKYFIHLDVSHTMPSRHRNVYDIHFLKQNYR